jgi:hypothetical protein
MLKGVKRRLDERRHLHSEEDVADGVLNSPTGLDGTQVDLLLNTTASTVSASSRTRSLP